MKHALITGISGFVGRHLREELFRAGWQVYGFDMRAAGENVFVGDLSDRALLSQVMFDCQPDAIFHLAGIIKSNDSEEYYKSNLFGTLNLLEAIMQSELRPNLLVASSSAVYGLTKSARPITERSPLRPVTEYAVSKAAQETAALRYHYAFGLPVVIVRMFNLLGPGQSPDLACSAFARQIALAELSGETEIVTGNLDAKRDFVDVRDAVRAFALLAEKGGAGQIYNICSGRAVAIQKCLREMMSQSRKQLSARIEAARVQKNDVPVQVGSFQKLHKVTGWNPRISLKQSLSDLLDDWRERVKTDA
ncbi:MAG: GDP-mannose 4,6 dehydratase [Chloroflexi bacterium]|nr:GDP-mannose 4,6 dehydratase [Chloroflexota bacterium]MDL1942678.1 NAD-dependent epimerase/dehydratase family protein [Chloroflexi bacterium CFX2]